MTSRKADRKSEIVWEYHPCDLFVRFVIYSPSIAPSQISDKIGLNPDRSWRKGDLMSAPPCKLRAKENIWEIQSKRKKGIDFSGPVKSLLERIRPIARRVGEICRSHHLETCLSCVAYPEGQMPAIHFDSEVIELLAELRAQIDVDLIPVARDGNPDAE